jgi:3-oxoacyl-[acyl-carrier-protein] synthase III/short-subunit dehydrogenase
MYDNYIFSGLGHSVGEHQISNDMVSSAVKSGYLEGFNEERIMASKNYQKFRLSNPDVTPFQYFVEYKMGFKTRNYVVPFPPRRKRKWDAESSLELGIKAIDNALKDADVHPDEIGAWIVSTVSPHEQAPGIAATIKSYFTKYTNQSQTYTLASGCSGFNVNLQRAVEFLNCNPEVNHVVVAHTETMSSFLTDITPFVPFVTFGDAATAVVLSRTKNDKKEGLISINNYQDPKMIDYVGVTKNWDLYIDNSVIKDRATGNILNTGGEVLKDAEWNVEDVDMLVPHQTGDAILKPVAEALGISPDKLYQEVQVKYGNVSGLGVPLGLSLLKDQQLLKPGMKILSATAGVGGEYGAFAYQVPENNQTVIEKHYNYADLKDTITLVTGATGGLGEYIAREVARKGGNMILQYTANHTKAEELKAELESELVKVDIVKSDFSDPEDVKKLGEYVLEQYGNVDYIIHSAGLSGSLSRASEVTADELIQVSQVNQFAPIELTKILKNNIKETILYIGSVAEDAMFAGSSAYVASKRGLHGFAASFAGEALSYGVRSVYYMPGLINVGMMATLDVKQIAASMSAVNQKRILKAEEVAERVIKSLYQPKVFGLRNNYDGVLHVRRDGFKVERYSHK